MTLNNELRRLPHVQKHMLLEMFTVQMHASTMCDPYATARLCDQLICRQFSSKRQFLSDMQLQHTRMIDESNPSCSICASVSVAADLKAVPKLLPCLEPKLGCATTPKTRHIFSVNTAHHKLFNSVLP